MDVDLPEKVGRYEIHRLLGAGAMGFVYLGTDPDLDRPVAVKTLRNLHLDSQSVTPFMERFRNEARAAARLDHPSIVRVYDVGSDETVGPYVVFEYVPGASLKEILKKGALTPADAIALAEQVGAALDVAHAAQIIHRDVKPDNLLVTEQGRTKLADFGVARIPDAALTTEGQFLGTPCYAAPETLTGQGYEPRSDLFSLAAVLYEAVSGSRAFPGTDAVAVAHRVVHEDPPPASQVAQDAIVPPQVDRVLLRGLAKDPAERFSHANAFAVALRAAYAEAGKSTENREDGTTVRPPRSTRPGVRTALLDVWASPAGKAQAAALLGALVLGSGVMITYGRPFPEPPSETASETASVPVDDSQRLSRARRVRSSRRPPPAAKSQGTTSADPSPSPAPDEDLADLSSHEREEAAKDAMAAAQSALAREDVDAARQALGRAHLLDPGNPDIDVVQAAIQEYVRAHPPPSSNNVE